MFDDHKDPYYRDGYTQNIGAIYHYDSTIDIPAIYELEYNYP